MKRRSFIVVLGAALTVSAFWYAQRSADRKTKVNVAVTFAIRQREQARDKIRQLAKEVTERETRRMNLQLELDGLKTKMAEMAAKATPAATKPTTPRDLLLNDPALQAIWLAARQARLSRSYGLLYQQLRLSPDQIEKLQAAMMQLEEQTMDLGGIAGKQDPADRAAIAALRKKAHEEFEAVLRNVLGDDGTRQLREYERVGMVRNVIGTVAGTAAIEGIPLTPAQAEQLTSFVATATKRYSSGGPADVTTVNWETVDAQMQPVLSPEQFEIFRRGRVEYTLDAAINRAKEAEGFSTPRG